MKDYLLNNEQDIINIFGFEWKKKEEREARGKTPGKISTIRDLLADDLVTMEAIKATGHYSPEELAAISKS